MDAVLVFERFNEEIPSLLFPINILRNYARLQVRHHPELKVGRQLGCYFSVCVILWSVAASSIWPRIIFFLGKDTDACPQARTPMIALFDVDMLPSATLFEELQNQTRLKW